MFFNYNNLLKKCYLEKLKYNEITNMSSMFENCKILKCIPVIRLLDTKKLLILI